MTDVEKLKDSLDFVSDAVRGNEAEGGIPSLYFLWGLLIFIGFASADLAPQITVYYFLVASTAGGLFSWWLGERTARREGINNSSFGRKFGWHWLVTGIGFLLILATMIAKPGVAGPELFLLLGGVSYSLAGIHLIRPLIYSGMLMLACYLLMILLTPPYAWALTGLVIGLGLLWTGLVQRARQTSGAA
ncbi:hypothetical protein [Microbulbifer sp. THAF38]|uniref:hypothetical protein n=1 Tax=Microbulbifer sp. THAF38 TaxID=2587856 RepID=UPI0012681B8B|nr:hypothetical protein [Microbulbifer sp. THAF38]QFT56923.1 hypothetical protein FIU95_20460 [Microbulbifer sp. THAF38]